jgi:hypothetical protein
LFRPCPQRANAFSFFKSLAQAGQTCFDFFIALPGLGKPFIFSFCLCPCWASHLFFYFTFARAGQAILFFILPLPALGKPFNFLFCLCPVAGNENPYSFRGGC